MIQKSIFVEGQIFPPDWYSVGREIAELLSQLQDCYSNLFSKRNSQKWRKEVFDPAHEIAMRFSDRERIISNSEYFNELVKATEAQLIDCENLKNQMGLLMLGNIYVISAKLEAETRIIQGVKNKDLVWQLLCRATRFVALNYRLDEESVGVLAKRIVGQQNSANVSARYKNKNEFIEKGMIPFLDDDAREFGNIEEAADAVIENFEEDLSRLNITDQIGTVKKWISKNWAERHQRIRTLRGRKAAE